MIDHKQNGKRNNDMDRTNRDEDSFNRTNVDDDNNPTYRQGSYQGARDSSSASRLRYESSTLILCKELSSTIVAL